tara:strand:+ start:61 stop:186 length:126 start_codon:yes stop_codon:yes gene_type:complete
MNRSSFGSLMSEGKNVAMSKKKKPVKKKKKIVKKKSIKKGY